MRRRFPSAPTAGTLAALAALALLAAACVAGVAGAGETYPLDRTVRLDVWGGGLEEVTQEIRRQTGVDLVYFRPDFVQNREKKSLYMVTGDVSLRLVMECLSRRFGCRYRLAESGRVEMSAGYGWVGTDFVVRFNDMEGLIPPDADIAAASACLKEVLRIVPLLNGNFSFTIEESPGPAGARSTKAVTILPTVLADYFDKLVRCLKGESGDARQNNAPTPSQPWAVKQERIPWDRLLAGEIRLSAGDAGPREIMREICADIDAAFLLNGEPDQGGRSSGLLSGTATFGRATEELAGILGLPRRVFLNPGAVVFEPGKEGEWEEAAKSREFFWTGLAVNAFDAKRLARRLGPGELVAMIRRNVFPGLWFDPLCTIVYNDAVGRLAVIAPVNVADAVAAEVRRMEEEESR